MNLHKMLGRTILISFYRVPNYTAPCKTTLWETPQTFSEAIEGSLYNKEAMLYDCETNIFLFSKHIGTDESYKAAENDKTSQYQ